VRTLCIALGNPLRGDDGVAHHVLDLLEPASCAALLRVQQLVPELGEAMAQARNVIFVDADVSPGPARIERISPRAPRGSPLAHAMTPAELVCLAARLFGFQGEAFVCHVPGIDFGLGQGLSTEAMLNAQRAAQIVGRLCANLLRSPALVSTPEKRESEFGA
jgi:hydrogenase maturation protease